VVRDIINSKIRNESYRIEITISVKAIQDLPCKVTQVR